MLPSEPWMDLMWIFPESDRSWSVNNMYRALTTWAGGAGLVAWELLGDPDLPAVWDKLENL